MRRRDLWSVAVAVGVCLAGSTACTSKPAEMGARDAAAGAGGAGGMAGLTGSAGGGGIGDGGIDVPLGVDGAVDVAAGTAPAAVCREAIAAQCQRLAECFDIAAYGCDESAILCPSYYFGPHSLRTVASVQACIASIRQMTCTDVQMGFASACLAGGTGEGGAPCSGASECASRYCSGIYPTCGTCAPALELGATCGSIANGACRSGTICHPATRVCVPTPLTVAHARAGEACDLSGNPPVGCEGALLCLPAMRGTTQGTCTSRAALPKAGEPCLEVSPAYSISCAPGLVCGLSTADGGRTSLCGDRAPCGSTTCAAGEYCFESSTVSIRCTPYAMAGQPCSSGAPEGDQRCAAELACTGGTRSGDGGATYRGTCNSRVALDEPCDEARECRSPLVCQQGRCARLDPETCFLPSDAGAGQ
jgi:hypothetical protein